MAVKTFTDNTSLPASDINTYLNNGGLVWISDTNLTSGSSVNINNVFSSTYRDYRVVTSFVRSTAGTAYTYLRLGGSATDHQMSGEYSTWNSATRTGDNGLDGYCMISAEGANSFSCDILAPQLAQRTFYNSLGGNNDYTGRFNVKVNNNTQFTGFTLLVSVGAFTSGKVSVYGYRIS